MSYVPLFMQQPSSAHVMCLWFAGPIEFTSMIGNPRSDTAFLALLKKETSPATRKAAPKQAAKAELTEGQIRKLKLKESDVAKVTREGISHLQFHPTSTDLVIATGDKQGHIALWDVDKKTTQEACAPPLCSHVYCQIVRTPSAGCVKRNGHAHTSSFCNTPRQATA